MIFFYFKRYCFNRILIYRDYIYIKNKKITINSRYIFLKRGKFREFFTIFEILGCDSWNWRYIKITTPD